MGRRPIERPGRHRLIGRSTSGERRTRLPGAALAAVAVTALVLSTGVWPASAAQGQWWLSKFGITQANKLTTGAGVVVAVLDTGVVAGPIGDLTGQVVAGTDLTNTGGPNADAGQGCSEQGGCYSHGTQMALHIVGTGRGAGFLGVAPGAKVMPVKVNSRTGTDDIQTANIAKGIKYAVDHGAKIISMSIGGPGSCTSDEAAATKYAYDKGVLVLAAAGNEGQSAVDSPANCPGVIAVGGVNQNDTPYAKTNSGAEVSFAQADGGVQETLSQKILTNPDPSSDEGRGTSDATAIAAGCFALLRAKFPNDSARMLVTRAINHPYADAKVAIGQRESDQTGYGVVLPYNAMTKATATNAPNPLFDKFAQQFGASGGPSSSSPGGTGSSSPGGSAPTSAPGGSATIGAAPSDSSSGSSTGLIIGVLIAIVVIVLILIAVFVRSRSRRTPAGMAPPPPGQWNPPGQAPPGQWPQGGPPPSGPPPNQHR